MDSKGLKLHTFSGSIARRVFFRAFFLASAISFVSLLRFLPNLEYLASLAPKTYNDCINHNSYSHSEEKNTTTLTPGSYLFQSRIYNTFWGSFDSMNNCKKDLNLTFHVVKELMGKGFLDFGARSLCIGEGSPILVSAMQKLGFLSVSSGVHKHHHFFSNKKKKIVYDELEYQDCSFDFVFSKDLDKVSVPPALFVLEVERILKPGGIGALLVLDPSGSSNSQVSSLLRSSTVVHVGYVSDEFSLMVFQKIAEKNNRSPSFFSDHQYHLPRDCASVTITKPLIELMEPLEERPTLGYEKRISYLPKFVNMSNSKRLVYIDVVGVGELLNLDAKSVTDDGLLPSYYPIDHKAFDVYVVHYNTSVLLSNNVKRPGITFVYHPGLSGEVGVHRELEETLMGEEEFDFLAWFKETVKDADFVVLKMNAGEVEMKFLLDMFESGAICFVDELFLSCSNIGDGESTKTMSSKEKCIDIYRVLRKNGVFVHQWWEKNSHQGPPQVVDVQ